VYARDYITLLVIIYFALMYNDDKSFFLMLYR